MPSSYKPAFDWAPQFQGALEVRQIAQLIQEVQSDALEHAARLCGDKTHPRFEIVQTLLAESSKLKTQIP